MFLGLDIKDVRLVKECIQKCIKDMVKPIISRTFDLKEIKEIINDPILDKDEKANEIKKLFTRDFNSNYIEYRSNGDKDKILSIEEYLHEIKPHLADIINEHKNKDEWKIQISIVCHLILFLLKIVMRFEQCIQKVIMPMV